MPQPFSSPSENLTFFKTLSKVTCYNLDLTAPSLPHAEKLGRGHKKFRMSAQTGWRQWSGSKREVQGVIIGLSEIQRVLAEEICL